MPTKIVSRSITKPTSRRPSPRRKSPAPKPVTAAIPTEQVTTTPTVVMTPIPTPDRAWWWLDRIIISLAGLLVLSGLIILGKWWYLKQPNYKSTYNLTYTNTPVVPATSLTALAPLTGLPATPLEAGRRPWAVVVENFPSVRPQSGLSSADLVFESPTEGGITRFLAIFQSQLPVDNLGPIRSARPYFNDWASTFGAFYSHSGGTAEALQQLKGGYGNLQDVNEFFNEHAYQRDLAKKAPHNLFTTPERFWSYAQNKNWPLTATAAPWFSFNKQLSTSSPATDITLPYYPADYSVNYIYQPLSGYYQRTLNGLVQTEAATQKPLAVKNALVLLTDITPIPNDPLLKVNLRTTGSGKLILFSQGQQYEGRWQKTTAHSPLKFTTPQGTALNLAPGNIWVSVMDNALEKDIKIKAVTSNP